MYFVQGTTPKIILHVKGADFSDASQYPAVDAAIEYYAIASIEPKRTIELQRSDLQIAKTDSGCDVGISLTQEQTSNMDFRASVRIQLKARNSAGTVTATDILRIDVGESIVKGVI